MQINEKKVGTLAIWCTL